MASIYKRMLNVNPGTTLTVRVSGAIQPDGRNPEDPEQEATIHIGANTRRVQMEIIETQREEHAVGSPELGRPALGIIENPATAGIKQR